MSLYFNFLSFSLISYFLIFLPSAHPRSDVIREIHSATNDGGGSWRDLVYCFDNHYVYGFNQKMDCSYIGVNVFRLYCASFDNSQSYSITSHDDSDGDWQTDVFCNNGDFMQSYYVSKSGCGEWFIACVNQLSLSDVKMKCITGSSYLSPGGGCSSDWTSPASCSTGEAICGYQTRFEDPWAGDDLRTTDSIFKCCCLIGYFLHTDPSNGQQAVVENNYLY